MRVGIYNHQHLRGGCPGCSQTYVKGMISDAETCKSVVSRYYHTDIEFINYTDLGDYPAEHVDRPGYRRMVADICSHSLDAVITVELRKISSDANLIYDFYMLCRENNVAFLTAREGTGIMETLDKLITKP